jgi:hypothetical protein
MTKATELKVQLWTIAALLFVLWVLVQNPAQWA